MCHVVRHPAELSEGVRLLWPEQLAQATQGLCLVQSPITRRESLILQWPDAGKNESLQPARQRGPSAPRGHSPDKPRRVTPAAHRHDALTQTQKDLPFEAATP